MVWRARNLGELPRELKAIGRFAESSATARMRCGFLRILKRAYRFGLAPDTNRHRSLKERLPRCLHLRHDHFRRVR